MNFPVHIPDHLLALATQWSIKPEDIEEHHTRGGGHGGQKINKSANCVELTHRPTGILVRHQHHRGLHQNRDEAYQILIQKVADHRKDEQHEKKEEEYREHHPQGWHRTSEGAAHTVKEKKKHGAKKRERTMPIESPGEPPLGNGDEKV